MLWVLKEAVILLAYQWGGGRPVHGSVQADQIMEELEDRWEEVRQSFGGDLRCIDAQVAHLTRSCS